MIESITALLLLSTDDLQSPTATETHFLWRFYVKNVMWQLLKRELVNSLTEIKARQKQGNQMCSYSPRFKIV